MQTTTSKAPTVKTPFTRECTSCGHIVVCSLFRAIAPLIEQSFTDETKPIEAKNLAQICNQYIPASLISALNSTQGVES